MVRLIPAEDPIAKLDQSIRVEIKGRVSKLKEREVQELKSQFLRASRFEPHLTETLSKNGIPLILVGLTFQESDFRPEAKGAGTVGIWQLQPHTARTFGLKVSHKSDERKDVLRSTNCTVKYLRYLHSKFGDWGLAIIGFKMGEGNLTQVLRKHQASSIHELFERGILTDETKNYLFDALAHGMLYQEFLRKRYVGVTPGTRG